MAETDGSTYGGIIYEYGPDGVRGIMLCEGDFTLPYEYYFTKDLQGNVVAINRPSGPNGGYTAARYAYDAWGNCSVTAYDNSGNVIADPAQNHIANMNPFRWKGHYFDKETGLYYINGSYYDPEIGRFISPIYGNFAQSPYALVNPFAIEPNMAGSSSSLLVVPENDENGWGWLRDFFRWYNNLHWGWKIGIGAAFIAGLAIATVATGGAAGSTAGFILAGMTKGAIIGAATGTAFGAVGGLIETAISNDWYNLGYNIVNEATGGFALGTITGAISGGISRIETLSHWNPGNSGSSFAAMKQHYMKHVVDQQLNIGSLRMGLFGGGMINYTKDAIALFSNYSIQAAWKVYGQFWKQNGWIINMKNIGAGKGLYDIFGKIIFFTYI